MAVIKNKGIYNVLKESIYQIELQRYDDMDDDIVHSEASRIEERLKNLNYPEDSVQEAIVEFYNYFKVKMK
jgi:hypothetical protein